MWVKSFSMCDDFRFCHYRLWRADHFWTPAAVIIKVCRPYYRRIRAPVFPDIPFARRLSLPPYLGVPRKADYVKVRVSLTPWTLQWYFSEKMGQCQASVACCCILMMKLGCDRWDWPTRVFSLSLLHKHTLFFSPSVFLYMMLHLCSPISLIVCPSFSNWHPLSYHQVIFIILNFCFL